MTDVSLKHVDRFIDRHGKPRHYFRFGRGKRIRLPGEPGSEEFRAAYHRAIAQLVVALTAPMSDAAVNDNASPAHAVTSEAGYDG